jgi:hypothetical protein
VAHADVCAGAATLQTVLVFSVLALSPNRDVRFAAPTLPLLSVVMAWALANAGKRAAALAGATLIVAAALLNSALLGQWPQRPRLLRAPGVDLALYGLHRDPGPAEDLAAIVQRTCGHGGFGAQNMVGVDLLRLSGHSLTYAAAKERLAGRAGVCHYDSIGFDSLEKARQEVAFKPYVYWITLDPQVRPIPPLWEFGNRTAPIVFRQLHRKGILQPEPWSGPPGVLLYRFVKQ